MFCDKNQRVGGVEVVEDRREEGAGPLYSEKSTAFFC